MLTPKAFADAKPKPPKPLTDPEYTNEYNEVVNLGSATSTIRSPAEELAGNFWAYDGTPRLCAPPRLYNQLALQVYEQNIRKRPDLVGYSDVSGLARYLALLNTAMADAGIAAWEAKWHYKFWRPVTGIHYPDDGNPKTATDAAWVPYGAPATNGKKNFTPPFPAYPSGHATFGGAIFQVLREIWGENTSFNFVSDEFNGLNFAAGQANARPFVEKTYLRFSDPEWENGRSRIWLGIHWQMDAKAGIEQGNKIGKFVFENKFQPR